MGVNLSSGNTSITGNVSAVITTLGLSIPSASQTQVTAKLTNAANGATIYTVSAGKTFYMMGVWVYPSASSFITIGNIQLAYANNSIPATISGQVIDKIPANTAITLTTGVGGNYATMWGFEQ